MPLKLNSISEALSSPSFRQAIFVCLAFSAGHIGQSCGQNAQPHPTLPKEKPNMYIDEENKEEQRPPIRRKIYRPDLDSDRSPERVNGFSCNEAACETV